jgi:hypothetical protein
MADRLDKKTNVELMELVRHKNQWIGRHAKGAFAGTRNQ